MLKFLLPMMIMFIKKFPLKSKLSFSILVIIFNLNLQKPEMTKISYVFMGDILSFWVTNLALWLMFILMFMKLNNNSMYEKSVTAMTATLIITFYNWNFMTFYIMFEISLIIILLIIMAWGYQPERIEAAMFMIIMTVMMSLPFFMTLMMNNNNLNFSFIPMTMKLWDYVSLMLIFMMKMPTFFLHLWLPKVHVESPIHGSMILASVLLKLGTYGLVRTTDLNMKMNKLNLFLIMSFSLWTCSLISTICLMQTDLKSIIAYSSIVHMTLVFAAITMNKNKSMMGALIIMLGHGMCSSGMFFMANIMYKNSKSRSIIINSGMINMMTTMSLLWFCVCMSNAPMPPSINILGEFLTFKPIANWSQTTYPIMGIIMFSSSFYSIFLFYLPTHGPLTKMMMKINPLNSKMTIISILHIYPLIALMTKPQMMTI